jgi:hypothetical protein
MTTRRSTKRERRRLIVVASLALGIVASPATALGHSRSQSFATWDVHGDAVTVVLTLPAAEATRLIPARDTSPAATGDPASLSDLLGEHVATRLAAWRGDIACPSVGAPRLLAARTGELRVERRFACPSTGALRLRDDVLFDAAPGHVRYARLRVEGADASELLFTADERERIVATTGASVHGGTAEYVGLGVLHILSGADHVAFLAALLLCCRRLREMATLATGFTVGHSLTLALAALGIVQPNMPAVESLIGFTIALVAVESVVSRGGGARLLAGLGAMLFFTLAVLRATVGLALPVATIVGLALFSFCYLPLVRRDPWQTGLRPLLTALFGLVHGLGFASVLIEAGLPPGRLVAALVGFNVGVEIGQLVLVAALWGVRIAVARGMSRAGARTLALDAGAAALCALGVFWLVARSLVG